ncbi:hypothetical protein AALA99_08825 [Anaerotruncus colihominis]|uniref:hypothetical protein n=1 Tax=Anaerotruncus colihominis TaxID=169435 RepID=UPI003512FBA4
MGFETFTKGMQDANEVLNRNFAAVETQLSNKANVGLERYGLPLMEGYENCGMYLANGAAVTIILYCYKSDKSPIEPNSTITVLPEGYRPATTMPFLGLCTNFTAGSDNRWPCYLRLYNDGRLEMSQIGTSVSNIEPKEIYASFTFAR